MARCSLEAERKSDRQGCNPADLALLAS